MCPRLCVADPCADFRSRVETAAHGAGFETTERPSKGGRPDVVFIGPAFPLRRFEVVDPHAYVVISMHEGNFNPSEAFPAADVYLATPDVAGPLRELVYPIPVRELASLGELTDTFQTMLELREIGGRHER